MNHHKREEVLKVFIRVCGTVTSCKVESIEFVGYGCLLIDFEERDARFIVLIISLRVGWCVNIVHNVLKSGSNSYESSVLRVSTCLLGVAWVVSHP